MELVKEIADTLELDYSIKKTETEEESMKYGVEINCLYGYCPGCHAMAKENPGVKQTPAMVVNGTLLFYGGFPGDDAIREALSLYL